METDGWSIGDLARTTGLTVRALRHFDEIGLLPPSARSPGGHRVYFEDDIRRLFVVVALRQLGLSLSEIGACVGGDVDVRDAISRRLARLEAQMSFDDRLRHTLSSILHALGEGRPVSNRQFLEAMEAMTMREQSTDAEAPDLYLLGLAQRVEHSEGRRQVIAVLHTFLRLGLVNAEFALAIKRMVHGRTTGADEAALVPPLEGGAPRMTAVLPVGRELHLSRAGTVWVSDLEVWEGQARLAVRFSAEPEHATPSPPVSPFEREQLLPGRFGELCVTDNIGTSYELAYCPGRGIALSPNLSPGATQVHIRPRHGATFEPMLLDLGSATALSFRPATPTLCNEGAIGPHMTALAEHALYGAALVAGREHEEHGLASLLERLRAVSDALRAVGALGEDEWCVEEVENALGGTEPTRPQWRDFLDAARHGPARSPWLVPIATDVGVLDGVRVTLRSLEGRANAMELNAALARAPGPEPAASGPSWFSSWAEALWRAEDDLGHLYLGSWGRSWPFTGEFSVSLRPALAEHATSLELVRQGVERVRMTVDVHHSG